MLDTQTSTPTPTSAFARVQVTEDTAFLETQQGFAAIPSIRLPLYKPENLINFWIEHVGLPPQSIILPYLSDLGAFTSDLALDRDKNTLTLDLTAEPKRENGFTSYGSLRNTMGFDFDTGTIKADFIYNGTGQKAPARALLRRALELGYAMGCSDVRIEATQKGNYLWADVFEVDEVNPNFIDQMKERLELLKNDIAPETYKTLSNLIDQRDIKAIASFSMLVPHSLENSAYMNLYPETMHMKKPPPITMGKYLLIDDMIQCWYGSADLENPEHCAKLEKRLGLWTQEILRSKAASLTPSVQNHTPDASAA